MKNRIIILGLLVILLVLNFDRNFLRDESIPFQSFQYDSESLVISKMFADKYKIGSSIYGLAKLSISGEKEQNISVHSKINDYDPAKEEASIKEYTSQFGLQGHIFSFLYNGLHIPIGILKLGCCTLLAIIFVAICYLIAKKYNILMAGVFYITFLLSPWVVAFARNLYWVEFTWFLPVLLGLILSMNYSKKRIIVPCIFLSIFVKCLCGYEYITTIMLATISFFIIDFFTTKDKEKRKEIFKTTIIVGIFCLLAFAIALCIHSVPRGNGNVIEGLSKIYHEDVLRRTVIPINAEQFADIYADSLNAGIIETVKKYFTWSTNIILGIEGKYFRLMLVAVLAILIYNVIKKEKDCYRDIGMMMIFFLTTISWLVLGKAHSYVHTHMNYVLWYFGFVQMCLYIILKFIVSKCKQENNKSIK